MSNAARSTRSDRARLQIPTEAERAFRLTSVDTQNRFWVSTEALAHAGDGLLRRPALALEIA